MTRSGPPPTRMVSVMGGFVANVYWRDIQPAAGAPIATNNTIDKAIAALHQLDPTGRMGIKVRLFAGIYAPQWAKSLGGPPIQIVDPVTNCCAGPSGAFLDGQLRLRLATFKQLAAAATIRRVRDHHLPLYHCLCGAIHQRCGKPGYRPGPAGCRVL